MNISQTYSHLNGIEFLIVHKPALWDEVKEVIACVDAQKCKTKVSKEKNMVSQLLYSPVDLKPLLSRDSRQGAGRKAAPHIG